MSPGLVQRIADQELELERIGVLSLSHQDFQDFFDAQARKLVSLSGPSALKRIRNGRIGAGLGWTELVLLSALMDD